MKTRILFSTVAMLLAMNDYLYGQDVPTPDTVAPATETVQTPVGPLTFEMGIPSKESVKKLYDALDFQRAVQAYLWATPAVHFDEWRHQMKEQMGLDYGDVAIWDNYCHPNTVGLTPNDTTIYAATHLDTSAGPIVIESPPGGLGMIDDIWERAITDVGPFGPDKGEGGKFLILPHDYDGEVPEEGYFVFRSPSRVFGYLVRGLVKNGDVKEAADNLRTMKIYPLAKKDNPPKMKIVSVSDKPLNLLPPNGFGYWERVAKIVNREPVNERDRLILGMLAPLGIQKGKPFEPDERQKKILTEAALVGHAMNQAISFDKRLGKYVDGSKWGFMLTLTGADQRAEFYDEIDERADYTYDGIWVAEGMMKPMIGKGSQYLTTNSDADNEWLDGGKNYTLHVPANPPANDFWSVTVYDALTRSQITNDKMQPSVGSHVPMDKNDDGTVDIFFGPKAPKGMERNWIQTIPGKTWFVFFRLYGPTEPFFEREWVLPNVEKVK